MIPVKIGAFKVAEITSEPCFIFIVWLKAVKGSKTYTYTSNQGQ